MNHYEKNVYQKPTNYFTKTMAWTNPLMVPVVIGATLAVMGWSLCKAIGLVNEELND